MRHQASQECVSEVWLPIQVCETEPVSGERERERDTGCPDCGRAACDTSPLMLLCYEKEVFQSRRKGRVVCQQRSI